jgi:peptide/nickel transport system permease protein
MRRFLIGRVLQMLIALLGVSIVVFSLIHIIPGDPVRVALGTRFNQELYDLLRARLGLDRPLIEQYLNWLRGAVTGDLGLSFRNGEPVVALIAQRLPATITLAGAALAVALAVALPAGILSAVRSGTALDYTVSAVSQVGISMPDFWAGVMYILLFSLALGWLPSSGFQPISAGFGPWLRHLTLPAITVGLISGSIITRFVRSAVLEAFNQDYVLTARARGLSEWQIVFRHVLPNAWIPIVTVVGLQLGFLIGGVVVVEVIFAWPGLGRLALTAVRDRDFTVLQGAVLYLSAMFLLINLIVDIIYAWSDPRVRVS